MRFATDVLVAAAFSIALSSALSGCALDGGPEEEWFETATLRAEATPALAPIQPPSDETLVKMGVIEGLGLYLMRPLHSPNRFLDVPALSGEEGTQMHQWTQNGLPNQLWWHLQRADGSKFIMSTWSFGCLDVAGGSPNDETPVIQWSCGPTANQVWIPQFRRRVNNRDYYFLKAAHSGKCMAVQFASQAIGARIVQAPCTEDEFTNDEWTWYPG